MNLNNILPISIENKISEYIKDKLDGTEYQKYSKEPIRDKVLNLLDTLCIVVYFPLENEDNNGFHITDMPFSNGVKQNFVYINTAQTMEKQVFTAAHELGHIWRVEKLDFEMAELQLDEKEMKELIINRFAATLLMPEELVHEKWNCEFGRLCEKDGKLTIFNLLKIIVLIMDFFFVPMKAVVLRLLELDIIDKDTANLMLGNDDITESDINYAVQKLISALGFVQFKNPTYKKWIDGFEEKLDKADKENILNKNKINNLRKLFDFKDSNIISEMNCEVSINKTEGLDEQCT